VLRRFELLLGTAWRCGLSCCSFGRRAGSCAHTHTYTPPHTCDDPTIPRPPHDDDRGRTQQPEYEVVFVLGACAIRSIDRLVGRSGGMDSKGVGGVDDCDVCWRGLLTTEMLTAVQSQSIRSTIPTIQRTNRSAKQMARAHTKPTYNKASNQPTKPPTHQPNPFNPKQNKPTHAPLHTHPIHHNSLTNQIAHSDRRAGRGEGDAVRAVGGDVWAGPPECWGPAAGGAQQVKIYICGWIDMMDVYSMYHVCMRSIDFSGGHRSTKTSNGLIRLTQPIDPRPIKPAAG
jgi:hypothetical protein